MLASTPKALFDGVVGDFAVLIGVKSQDNAVFANTGPLQIEGHAIGGIVALNPKLVVFDVNMHNGMVNAVIVLPTDIHQKEMLVLTINNQKSIFAVAVVTPFLQNLPSNEAITAAITAVTVGCLVV
jgi:hypothetical protein